MSRLNPSWMPHKSELVHIHMLLVWIVFLDSKEKMRSISGESREMGCDCN